MTVASGGAIPSATPPIVLPEETGSDTFGRYRWQAKIAVLHWLTCLQETDAALGVICEGYEDLVLAYVGRRKFAQLKTRSKGSWSLAKICEDGGGLDSLARAYLSNGETRDTDEFQLWLEGPAAEDSKTATFFSAPSSADAGTRTKLGKRKLKAATLDDFLSKLSVRADQPARATIDAVVLKYVGALWPSFGSLEQEALYLSLLAIVEQAQAGELQPPFDPTDLLLEIGIGDDHPAYEALTHKSLTANHLRSLTPPTIHESREDLLARIERGEVASALELKMRAGGASEETIAQAQTLRALADRRRQELRASSDDNNEKIDALESDLVDIAKAQVELTALLAGSNPSIAARPADYVAGAIRSNAANLLAVDEARLFGNASDLYGLLCQASDECKFYWRKY